MAEFISTFVTGFQDVVEKDFPGRMPGAKIINVYDGLIHYKFDGNSRDLEKIIYFNNTFFVIKTFNQKNCNFSAMVNQVCTSKNYYLISKGSFRCRFSQENQFVKVDKNLVKRAEENVLHNSRLTIDRVSPSTEIWYSIRREGFGFCGQLISKREFTEKNLNKGELRPEIAYLIAGFANLSERDVVADVFAGYGSIPVQIAKKFRFSYMYVSDISSQQYDILRERKQLNADNIQIEQSDAFELSYIADKSVDVVITDPPWGYFEEIDDIPLFYEKMFTSFKRILKDEGRMVILSARKTEIEETCGKMNIKIKRSLHTLVNGKKASLYEMNF